jgi:PAS domain S-box-containing protein
MKRPMRRAHTKACISIAILLACCRCASALDPSLDINQYAHTSWKIRDGFSKGIIYAIAQTPDGYLWLGTEFGLLRFDGVRAVPWQPPAGQHLPSSEIRSLLAARDGTLWIGTMKGLASLKDGRLTQQREFSGPLVHALLEDREGTVWAAGGIAPFNARLCAIQGGKAQCYGYNDGLGTEVFTLYEDSRGNLWAGATTGLWRLKPGPPKLYRMPQPIPDIMGLTEGEGGELLINMTGGLRQLVDGKVEPYPLLAGRKFTPGRLLLDRNGGLWITNQGQGLTHVHQGRSDVFAQSDGLSGDYVNGLFEDREGNVWVGTHDGLDRFREFPVPTISTKQGLSNPYVRSVLADRDGSIWLSTQDGLNRWKDGQITIYRKRSGLPDDDVESLFQDGKGRLWVSTHGGVACPENGRFTKVHGVPIVNSFAGDSAGNLWVGDELHGLFHLEGGSVVERIPWTKLGVEYAARTLATDPSGSGLWLGSFVGGVTYLKDGRVRGSYGVADGLGAGRVDDLLLDRDGTLWASTQGGLSRIKNGRVSTLTSKNGLPCDTVHWMMEDDANSVWLYTACGLVRFPRPELDAWAAAVDKARDTTLAIQVTVFDGSDGVRSHSTSSGFSPSVTKSTDGKLWFLPYDGVSVIDPRHIPFNKLPPPVHIEQIVADGKTYWQNWSGDASSSPPKLPPLVRDLTIDYTALSLVVPEKVHFRFKLEGQDKDWREVVNDRRVEYSNLPPRHYRFRVMASNNSGVWNETGASLDFTIDPAYWQTNWFRALCVLALMALLWAAYLMRVRQLRQQERKLRDVVETIPTIAWTALPDGWVDFSNHHWEEYTGLSIEKGSGSGWETAVHPEDVKRHAEKWRASVASGEPFENEARYRRADGAYRWFLVRAVPLRDGGGKIRKWYGTKTDIEDRKRAEQLQSDLAHVNRVTTLGELAASISHELKQPIAAAMTNANTGLRWLRRDKPDVEEASEAMERIVKDNARAAEIIDRLRSLYKKSPPKRESLDVNDVILEMVVLLRSEANRYAVSIRTDLGADLSKVMADRVQMQQVLMNIMLNGIEAMKDTGGVLTVKTQPGKGDQVMISVSDTGVGLPEEKVDRIFDAFFTTKPQGSGMGLAISRSIIEAHGGHLWATANDGRGAAFHFTLPIAAEVRVSAAGS